MQEGGSRHYIVSRENFLIVFSSLAFTNNLLTKRLGFGRLPLPFSQKQSVTPSKIIAQDLYPK